MRFYLSYTNRRGNTYGAGTRDGDPVHVRGWDAGVEVVPRSVTRQPDGTTEYDAFDIYMTRGSNGGAGSAARVHIGRVHDTKDGAWFEPLAGKTLLASPEHVSGAE